MKVWGEGIIGKQLLGQPGSRVVTVTPTSDYLVNGPVGDGWYDSAEKRYVTTDFLVKVTLEDGRTVDYPMSYKRVHEGTGFLTVKGEGHE